MATYRADYAPTTKTVMVTGPGGSSPGGLYTQAIGTFEHDSETDLVSPHAESHAIIHHVRDLLYKRKPDGTSGGVFPNNITDLAGIKLNLRPVTGISSLPATVTLDISDEDTQQITNTFTPLGAMNQKVYYRSSDPTKATVSDTGLITPVAAGSATITITTDDGGFTDTCVVTVQA